MPPKAKGAKKKNGYQMPEKFIEGFVVTDIYKKPWTLGKPIGQGGFGLIYLANRGESQMKRADDAEYVVKIEPKDNGPLFCETHFYINCAKEDDIKNYMRSKSLKHLAIPRYISSGMCTYNDKDYRFLVMDRYQADVQSILEKTANKRLDEMGALCLMRQVLASLEYIHQKGYVHGDIKGANILLKNDQEAYLVDYGLAVRFMRDNVHQKYDVKPERRHNGTIEYTSIEAHEGAKINRRSDLEILGYCVIHWLSGTLPWIDMLKNPEQVQSSKTKSMKNVKEFINNTIGTVDSVSNSVKNLVEYYLNEVNKLQFDTEPPYGKILSRINETLKALGQSESSDHFNAFSQTKTKKKSTTKETLSALALNDEPELVESPNRRKQPRRVRTSKTKEEQFVVDDTDESDKEEAQTSKKSKIIIPGLLVNAQKPSIVSKLNQQDEIKSPRLLARAAKAEENATPLKKTNSKTENVESNLPKWEDLTPKYTLRTTPKRQLETTTNSDNKHDNKQDLLSKINGINSKPPRSPLTVTSVNHDNKVSAETAPILIKRKRNVAKSTVATQTENSYLASLLNNRN